VIFWTQIHNVYGDNRWINSSDVSASEVTTIWRFINYIIMPASIWWWHCAMMAVVCPSVCPVPDPKSRPEGHRKLKIGRKTAHDTGDPWPHLEVERSKFKVTRHKWSGWLFKSSLVWHTLAASCTASYYRQDCRKAATAGIVFTRRPKISIFALQGQLIAPIHVKFGTAEGTQVRLSEQNFASIGARCPEVGMRPPK